MVIKLGQSSRQSQPLNLGLAFLALLTAPCR